MHLRDPLPPSSGHEPAARPALPQPHHPRPQALARLSEALAPPATRGVWIAAGPGCGKTVLAAEWARAEPQRSGVWLRLDAADEDPAWLWQRLFEAAGLPLPGALARIEAWAQPHRATPKAARALSLGLGDNAAVVLDGWDAAGPPSTVSGRWALMALGLIGIAARASQRRRIAPTAARPISSIAQLCGSGTATASRPSV